MAPVFSSLRHQHVFNYLVQWVLLRPRPRDTAKCVQAWIGASGVLDLNKVTEAPGEIFPMLPDNLRIFYYPSSRNGNTGPLDRKAQNVERQSALSWELISAIIHYQCIDCGLLSARCAQVKDHVQRKHYKKDKQSPETLRLHVEAILPGHIYDNKAEWIRALASKQGGHPIPPVLGKRDVHPIAAELNAAMQAIIEQNPPQLVLADDNILPPPPPPTPAVDEDFAPSPVAAASSSNDQGGKRKADSDLDEDEDAAPLKRARLQSEDFTSADVSTTLDVAVLPSTDVPAAVMTHTDVLGNPCDIDPLLVQFPDYDPRNPHHRSVSVTSADTGATLVAVDSPPAK